MFNLVFHKRHQQPDLRGFYSTKCQGLCSPQEHFPQKVAQCLKHLLSVVVASTQESIVTTLSSCRQVNLCWTLKRSVIGWRIHALKIRFRNSAQKNVHIFSYFRSRGKLAMLRRRPCYSLKLSISQILFTASSSSLSSPSSPSLTTAHLELHGFVEYSFVYPVPGVFQEYACIVPQPLSKSHYSLISLVYLLWWSAQIDMTAE